MTTPARQRDRRRERKGPCVVEAAVDQIIAGFTSKADQTSCDRTTDALAWKSEHPAKT